MRNIFKKGLFIAIACLLANVVWADTMYVVSGKCNVPLKAGMSSAKYQIFKWDGSTATVTTDVTSSVNGTGGSYYNSTSLAVNDLKTLSKYNASSTQNRTMQAIKLAGSTTMTISFTGKTMSKIIVVGRANSTDALSIDILGETKNTNNKDFFVVEKSQTFSNSISISNTTSKEFHFFVYLFEGQGPTPPSPDPVAVTGVTLNKKTTSIAKNASETLTVTVTPSNASNPAVTWSSTDASKATVDNNGKVTGVAAGTAKIIVKSAENANISDTCTVTVTDSGSDPTPVDPTPVPTTDLTTHVPEIYEAKGLAGYGGELTVINGREYEVYYMTRDAESKFCIATTNADKTKGITTRTTNDYSCAANDGWFRFSGKAWSSSSDAMGAEFGTMARRLDIDNTNEFIMHVSGFDEFAIVARDKKKDTSSGQTKPGDNKYLEVYVNDVLQAQQFNASPSIRRYAIPTAGCVVRIKHIGGDNSSMYAFSLRLAQEPRTKHLDGNDSTQVVYQTMEPAPIFYYTKYNSMGETKLVWDGEKATGLTLQTSGTGSLGDTLVIGGTAQCPVGIYNYRVESYKGTQKTSSVNGKITVATLLRSNSRDTVFEAYAGEEMDQISYSFYALNPSQDISLTWTNGTPDGVTGSVSGNKYIISGTPTTKNNYPFTISIAGGNSINGELRVFDNTMGDNPVMYLYKNSNSYNNDGVYNYLTSGSTKIANLVARKANESGARTAAQYAKYKWILISEDVDADNPEVLAIIRDKSSNLPILNMKSFTYAADRLNWGEPNNGTLDTVSKNGGNIFIVQPEHPIFKNLNGAQGTGKLQVLTKTDNKKGVMPIDINKCDGSLCLATAYTRNRDNYFQDGELQTVIHEIPAAQRNGRKYICFPLSNTKDNLTAQGKTLLKNIVAYLTSADASVALPTLRMESFSVAGYTAKINQNENLIELELTEQQFTEADSLREVKPVITLADSKTHVLPAADETLDLRYTTFLPKTFVVTDYINRRTYDFKIRITRPQGIDEVYTAGQWVNIFDIYGRKIATTNEDIYTMDLPRGIYLVVTETGNTIKIIR